VKIVDKYAGAPYKLGGRSRAEGYDCFSLVLALGEDFGVVVPETFEGQTMETYSKLWMDDPGEAKRVMLELFGKLAKKIPVGKMFASDILILDDGGEGNVGIHAGKDLALSVFTDVGVRLVNIRIFRVTGAYRWVPSTSI